MNRFEGSSVLLTGAGSGIGQATALRLVAEGAAVFAVDVNAEGLAATAASATAAGAKAGSATAATEAAAGASDVRTGRLVTHVADVTDEGSVVAAVEAAVEALGGLDVLVNVAGMHRTTPIATLTAADLRQLFEVNLVGTALFCREALRHLPDRTGVIVNVASSAAAHGNPYMTAYAASKGAVLGFSLSLAAELVGRGIRVVPISPGSVDTPLTAAVAPNGLDFGYYSRIRSLMGAAVPEQIAGVIAFAASRDASYLTGVDLRVDGGSHV